MATILFASLFVTLFLGIPIGVCMGFAVLATILISGSTIPPYVIAQRMFTSVDNFVFMAVPFFIYAGEIMQKGGISQKLVGFARVLLGGVPAGLSVITTVSSGFFGAISGSNPATVAAIGGVMVPKMKEAGYPVDRAAAIAAASGTLGVVIPPSISMITYAMVGGVSVTTMFACGLLPGVLMALCISGLNMLLCRKYEAPVPRPSMTEFWIALKEAIWALMMPVIILGGIYGGIFTPTEAAAVSCVYSFIVSKYVYKELGWKDMYGITVKAAISTALVLFIVALASPFSWLMTSTGIPGQITKALLGVFDNRYILLLMINFVLLFFGCFLETQSIILLLTPMLLPLASTLGLHPVALGVIMVINTSIGMITPPMAVNLFVASGISGVSIPHITQRIIPYFVLLVGLILLFTYFPRIITVFA